MTAYRFTIPAIRGHQAGQDCFVTMCPLNLLSSLFPDDDDGLGPELASQRSISTPRVAEISRYVTTNLKSYVMPAITATVDSPVKFEPSSAIQHGTVIGFLHIPLTAKFLVVDGIHRCASLKASLKEQTKLGEETVAVLVLVDPGFKRSNQIYTDIKRHERRTARSLSILHDDRDDFARLVRRLVPKVPVFAKATEMARTTISNRSRKLFTLSAIYHATKTLLEHQKDATFESKLRLAKHFWNAVAQHVPDWQAAVDGEIAPAVLRREMVHSHGIALAALGRVGTALLKKHPKTWESRLSKLQTIDWSRANIRLWEGRAMIGGRISKAHSCIVLTGNAIKAHLGIPLNPAEQQIEEQFIRGHE